MQFSFYYADADVLGVCPDHELVACPGHPQYGKKATKITFPVGTVQTSKPTRARPCAHYAWKLPTGHTVAADYRHLHAKVR